MTIQPLFETLLATVDLRGGWRVLFFSLAMLAGGCATVAPYTTVAEDHSVRLVSRPITAPAELVWRVKVFGRQTASRLHVRFRRFPKLERSQPRPLTDGPFEANAAVAAAVSRRAGLPVPGTVSFLVGGEAAFGRIEAEIAAATNRIDIQTYIFDNDVYAVYFADLLRERNARQVQVRILLDSPGSRRAWNVVPPGAPEPPFGTGYSIVRYLKQGSTIEVRRSHNIWLSSDHVKFMIIDDHCAFLGGMNIGWQYRYDWRDMMSELRGPVVQEIETYFEGAWSRAGWFSDLALLRNRRQRREDYQARDEDAQLYPLVTTPWRHGVFRVMLEAISKAKQRVYIENPYLWNKQILYELCAARHRGVDVRVVLPLESNIEIGRGADRRAANTLLHHQVRVFLYPGMTHKKATIIDDWALWGSANFDDLSLHKNLELNLATRHGPTVDALAAILLEGQDLSQELQAPLPTGVWDALSSMITNLL